ncbi:MAG: hypothetical protein P8130_01280 [Deltaproteobacteria bacterium]
MTNDYPECQGENHSCHSNVQNDKSKFISLGLGGRLRLFGMLSNEIPESNNRTSRLDNRFPGIGIRVKEGLLYSFVNAVVIFEGNVFYNVNYLAVFFLPCLPIVLYFLPACLFNYTHRKGFKLSQQLIGYLPIFIQDVKLVLPLIFICEVIPDQKGPLGPLEYGQGGDDVFKNIYLRKGDCPQLHQRIFSAGGASSSNQADCKDNCCKAKITADQFKP